MNIEQMEKDCIKYEEEIMKLGKENRELKEKIRNYENIVFALKSILEITN